MRIVPLLAKVAFWAFAVSLVIGLVAAFGTRFEMWNFRFGLLTLFPWCIYIGLGALAAGVIWLIASRIAKDNTDARLGAIGLAGAALVLSLPLYNIYVAKTSPPIHDISTDTERPPAFVAVLPLRKGALNGPEYDGPTKVKTPDGELTTAALQKKAYPDIRTIAILTPPARLFERAQKAANAMGWDIVAVVPDQGRIEATDTTMFFGFKDDIVIRVKPAGMGAKLDIRSKSRVGVSDVGKNAARIRAFIKKLANS